MNSMASCFCLKRAGRPTLEEHSILACETSFTVNEVEALYILYEKLSSSITDDGLLHKEDFQLALLDGSNKHTFFADRLFDLFDLKHNGVIGFGEFVRSLSIFHPRAPEADKIAFSFKFYDLRCTGYIEHDEGGWHLTHACCSIGSLKEMVLALLRESELTLPDDVVEAIVNKTIMEADLKGDGRIDPEEWKELVARHPSVIKNMTLPHLKEITLAFPSFVMKTRVQDSELFS